ncbi:MAG TPA: hypothetical protein VLF95_11540 [Vicinamibacteria bacterium]|nr:hypothetical protein [Vicinamibacteria bacterium]
MARRPFGRGEGHRKWGRLLVPGVAALLALAGPGAGAWAEEGFRCELREARGVPPADAATAADLVCAELRRASGGRGAYGVGLGTLGRIVIVTATREQPAGSVSVQVDGLEEVPTAAPRIADALASGQGLATTQRVDNLLEVETRRARAKKGSVKFAVGVADVESAGHGGRATGFSLGLMYSTPRFALPIDLRFAWDDAQAHEKGLDLAGLSIGGRAYLSKKDVSPFVGGGLGILKVDADDGGYSGSETVRPFYGERSGAAPYVEAGVEMLRLHRGRVALLVRADFPTGSLRSEAIPAWSYRDEYTGRLYEQPGQPAQSSYVVPVTIGVSVAF